jgi:hypothetical protein
MLFNPRNELMQRSSFGQNNSAAKYLQYELPSENKSSTRRFCDHHSACDDSFPLVSSNDETCFERSCFFHAEQFGGDKKIALYL